MITFDRLRDIREDHDLSQEQMAKILHVKRSRYSLWELGINIIPLKYLIIYADYFNYSIDYILGLSNNREKILLKKGYNKIIIGKNIKRIRKKMDISQKKLANKLRVSQACIAKYEKGLIDISTSNLYELSKEFNIPMNNICGKSKNIKTSNKV